MDYAERIAEVYGMTPAEAEQIERELAEWEDEKSQAEDDDGDTVELEY